MTIRQYQEWLTFFKIRGEDTRRPAGDAPRPRGGYGTTPEGQRRMSGDIVRALTGYQRRRERLK